MKKVISLLLLITLILSLLVSCDGEEPKDETVMRIGYMQGPTGMGMAKLIHDNGGVSGNEKGIRPFFSFSSFVLQNENPVIFDWRFHQEIGKGAMSRVFLATNIEDGGSFAAKVYNKNVIMRQNKLKKHSLKQVSKMFNLLTKTSIRLNLSTMLKESMF